MSSFRSNLDSVSGTHGGGFAAIPSRLTTCFKQLRHKLTKIEQKSHLETVKEQYRTTFHIRHEHHIKWYQQNYKDSRLLQKANENLRNITIKFKQVFWAHLRFSHSKQREIPNCEKKKLIAKLLSSTLIASQIAAPFDCSASDTTIAPDTGKTLFGINSKMTIMGDSFLGIREENPDIDREIRSILIARTQTGATIAEIKEDYRKNTGLRFPVYKNITDFLLCIPGVMAYCNESGTRIFNVKPNEKNRHIHDLVTNQKAPSERYSVSSYCNNRNEYTRRDSGFSTNTVAQYRSDPNYNSSAAIHHPSWRSNNFYKKPDQSIHANGSVMSSSSFQNPPQPQQQFFPPTSSVEENNSPSESDGFMENRGGYYQDNCQYLYNRIHNYENVRESVNGKSDSNSNNMNIVNDNPHLIVPHNAGTQNQIPTTIIQPDHSADDANLFKRPLGRALRSSVIRSSSPSGTRSSQRSISDSICSTELDYEAHLLDFPLLGDDFFLYLARMELRCKFKQNQKILQSGLCISGQTIKAATKRFRNLPFNGYGGNRRIIVNIGSVDIMQGKPLVQIEHEFRTLINVINKRGYQPILTTLAPLANYAHDSTVKLKVERFNDFIKREGQFLLVVDIWALFMSERKQILFGCYQNEPRQVTGANESYVFWNKIGRQRVLQLIESNLEY